MESLAQASQGDDCNSSWGDEARLRAEEGVDLSLEGWISVEQSPELEGHARHTQQQMQTAET